MTTRPERRSEAFFGRRRGKALRARQAAALDGILPRLELDLSSPAPDELASLFDAPVEAVWLEIGFGGGEHLAHRVAELPQIGFIGVEPFVNGMAKLMTGFSDRTPENLRVFGDDAIAVLDWLPENSISGIDLLYPDPWPKKKHWKRRFVNKSNLDRMARILKPKSLFRFASDIDTYVNWTLALLRDHPNFDWQAQSASDWREPWPGWPGTRYEDKALRHGRRPAYLSFRRK